MLKQSFESQIAADARDIRIGAYSCQLGSSRTRLLLDPLLRILPRFLVTPRRREFCRGLPTAFMTRRRRAPRPAGPRPPSCSPPARGRRPANVAGPRRDDSRGGRDEDSRSRTPVRRPACAPQVPASVQAARPSSSRCRGNAPATASSSAPVHFTLQVHGPREGRDAAPGGTTSATPVRSGTVVMELSRGEAAMVLALRQQLAAGALSGHPQP